jgi:hypothetical protein
MVYDLSYPTIDMDVFKPNDWKSFYGNVKESIPSNALGQRKKYVDLRLYVDSNHAGEKRTCCSRTGFFVFMNTALVRYAWKDGRVLVGGGTGLWGSCRSCSTDDAKKLLVLNLRWQWIK